MEIKQELEQKKQEMIKLKEKLIEEEKVLKESRKKAAEIRKEILKNQDQTIQEILKEIYTYKRLGKKGKADSQILTKITATISAADLEEKKLILEVKPEEEQEIKETE